MSPHRSISMLSFFVWGSRDEATQPALTLPSFQTLHPLLSPTQEGWGSHDLSPTTGQLTGKKTHTQTQEHAVTLVLFLFHTHSQKHLIHTHGSQRFRPNPHLVPDLCVICEKQIKQVQQSEITATQTVLSTLRPKQPAFLKSAASDVWGQVAVVVSWLFLGWTGHEMLSDRAINELG